VTVSSVRGAEILRLKPADIRAALDTPALQALRTQVRDSLGWRSRQADRVWATVSRTVASSRAAPGPRGALHRPAHPRAPRVSTAVALGI
jgi:hypothetical protein